MEYVDAIRDRKQIDCMKKVLKQRSPRDYLFFVLGINTGLKSTHMLSLRKKDVLNDCDEVVSYWQSPNPCSTSKEETFIYLNRAVRKAIKFYTENTDLQNDDYLFLSAKTRQPISRQQAYRILQRAAQQCKLPGKIGLHSLRKTFGYHAYQQGVAISLLQRRFHHATPAETYRYIGIERSKEARVQIDVNL
ncbi:tyrosine-type recombinase/integrase [Bacillus fonticola]|uniref:tyrosine-type recombinase/integrase n=1 Tax=Bacillus fonticola TaxID=2728853 RepID=UPI001473E810|nr:tyrosine-type recombinase/integrase [Bacillus fonticola]